MKINETRENDGTFLRIQLCIKGFSIVDWVYHFTSKKEVKREIEKNEKNINFIPMSLLRRMCLDNKYRQRVSFN